jgi:hypothetical protein
MKYIASSNRITFSHNGLTTTICRENNSYFDKILDSIHKGFNPYSAIPDYVINPRVVEEQTSGLIRYENGQITSDDFYFPQNLNKVLTELLDKDLPILPLTKLCRNLSHLSTSLSEKIASLVAYGEIPISWDGSLITYARSSWIVGNYEVEDWMERGFIPHETRTGQDLITGTFDWATRNCPDQGRIFDLLVQPQYITNVENNIIHATQLTNISTLEETTSVEDRIQLIETETNHLGETLYVRSPFSNGQLSHYIASSFDCNTTIPEKVKVTV